MSSGTPQRMPTGVAGLDTITEGGLVPGDIYLLVGHPGAGKSILANQIAAAHAARSGRVVYATLLSESHTRLLAQLRRLSFFNEATVGKEIVFLNALGALEKAGLEGLLDAIRHMVREQDADLLVLDGLVSPAQLGVSDLEYKKFVAALQSWVSVVGCTVVIVRTGLGDTTGSASAEQTMVDGIFELGTERREMRTMRHLTVAKLRSSAFVEGRHAYRISSDGLEVYPRLEATHRVDESKRQPFRDRVSSGTPGLDELLGGAVVRGSTTLLIGSSGCGKSIASLQFGVDGARAGEPVVFFGFFEPPHALVEKGERLGMPIAELREKGLLHIAWHDPAEPTLDHCAHELLSLVSKHGAKRVIIDGFAGLRTADHPERVSGVFTVLTNELSRNGVTTFVTDETRELFVRDVHIPTQHVSALFHNIVFMRQVEVNAELHRLVSVMKTRDTGHDRRLWKADIDDNGLRLLHPFKSDERALMRGGNGTGDAASARRDEPREEG